MGASDGLSSERAYVREVLPRAVVRGLGQGPRGLQSSAAILACLAVTSAGYLRGRLAVRQQAPALLPAGAQAVER